MTGLLDVIVPMKNAAAHLPLFFDTVRANSPEGCRYLVVDDGSTDQTAALLSTAALPQLEIITVATSGGVSAARNHALARIDAELVAFYDVDDWLAPGHWQALIDAHRRTGAAIVRTDHVRVNGYRRVPQRAPGAVRDVAISTREAIGDAGGQSLVDYPFLWAGLFDAQQVPFAELPFDEDLRTASDRPWFWRLFLADFSVAVVSSPGYFYRREADSGSLTENAHEALLDIVAAMARVVQAASAGRPSDRRRAAYTTAIMTELHIARRERLSTELQQRLISEAAAALAEIDPADLGPALAAAPAHVAEIAGQLHAAGRRWRA